jgi:methylenetetrahydrofolate dehydrogenase (NADP+)/methenyltetrahydrofolate cyclohydrolase
VSATIIDGEAIAAEIRDEVAADVRAVVERDGRPPHLTAILVGDDPVSHSYVRGKARDCKAVGILSEALALPADITMETLLAKIAERNANPDVSGMIVQLPLPNALDDATATRAVDPAKDVDGLHPVNLGLLARGEPRYVSATPSGVQQMLMRSGHDPAGKRVVVVGRSTLVGRPVAMLLSNKGPGANATVTMAHTGTADLAAVTREAEILIVAAGQPRMVTAEMVAPGAVVIDVGVNRVDDASRKRGYRLVGDVDFDAVSEVASAITPVPGGVGPLTRAMLLVNTVKAASQ